MDSNVVRKAVTPNINLFIEDSKAVVGYLPFIPSAETVRIASNLIDGGSIMFAGESELYNLPTAEQNNIEAVEGLAARGGYALDELPDSFSDIKRMLEGLYPVDVEKVGLKYGFLVSIDITENGVTPVKCITIDGTTLKVEHHGPAFYFSVFRKAFARSL
jgi:hypothetical protein